MQTRLLAELEGNKLEVTTRYTNFESLPAFCPVSEKYTDDYTLTSDAGNVFRYDSLTKAADAWNSVCRDVMWKLAKKKAHAQKEEEHLDAIASKLRDLTSGKEI